MRKQKQKLGKIIFPFLVIFIVVMLLFQTYFFRTSLVEGESMSPTLATDDVVLIDRLSAINHVKRGDIVSCKYPNDTRSYIKRVIGAPGDIIEIKNGRLCRNNIDITLLYYGDTVIDHDFNAVVVPENTFFVIGDNINDSYDSRKAGFVKCSDIIGIAVARFSPNPEIL